MNQPQPADAVEAVEAVAVASFRTMLFGNGPRFARDAFGPVLAFYIGWKLEGRITGVVLAAVVALTAWWWERRNERSGLLARLSLAVVVVQTVIGLLATDAKVFLAQPVLVGGAWGVAFLVSAAIRRPLIGVFANEFFPFPPEVRASETFRKVFTRLSILWGIFTLMRASVRIVTLSSLSIDGFVVVSFVTGAPLTAGLVSWSVWYGRRAFERSEEWGWAFAPESPVPAPESP